MGKRIVLRRQLPVEEQLDIAPRAVAETAILVLNEERRRGNGQAETVRQLIDRVVKTAGRPVRAPSPCSV